MSSAKCVICTDEFPGIDDLEAHISSDHYNCLPFECEKCKFAKFPTEFAIKRHYEEDHGLVEYFIRYRVSREIYEKKQKIRECLERCIRHSDVSSGQHQIASMANRAIIGGDYAGAVSSTSNSSSHYHQSRPQLHESEFLSPPKLIRAGSGGHSELFQQPHGGPLLSSSAAPDLRHQHHQQQPDFVIGGAGGDGDQVSGYEGMGGPNLIGNLLEQIKPEMDNGQLSHFDQLYTTDVGGGGSGAGDGGPRGLDKFIGGQPTHQPPSSAGQDQLMSFLAASTQQKQPTVSISMVTSPGTPILTGKQPSRTSMASSSSSSLAKTSAPIPGSAATSQRRRPSELQCQVCKQMVVNRSTSLLYHVNVKHLHLAMFKCRSCGEEFQWNKSAAIRHAHRHGGDESLVENNSERLFPTLNRHRREYFNLPKRGPEDSPTPPPQQQEGEEEGQQAKRAKFEEDGEGRGAEEEEDEEQIVVDEEVVGLDGRGQGGGGREGRAASEGSEGKKEQTPNSILAQLVDMTRGGDGPIPGAEKAPRNTSGVPQGGGTSSQGSGQHSAEQVKAHKSIQCGGCGDQVINQEWIMLNHVNTKHLHLPLYKCVTCNKPFENYLRSYAVRHAKFYHQGDEGVLLDQREVFLGQVRDACAQLFDKTPSSSGGVCLMEEKGDTRL